MGNLIYQLLWGVDGRAANLKCGIDGALANLVQSHQWPKACKKLHVVLHVVFDAELIHSHCSVLVGAPEEKHLLENQLIFLFFFLNSVL